MPSSSKSAVATRRSRDRLAPTSATAGDDAPVKYSMPLTMFALRVASPPLTPVTGLVSTTSSTPVVPGMTALLRISSKKSRASLLTTTRPRDDSGSTGALGSLRRMASGEPLDMWNMTLASRTARAAVVGLRSEQ